MLFAIGFVCLVAIGTVTHVMVLESGAYRMGHDTYYVIDHFRIWMVLSAMFPLFSGWYYCFPKVTGRAYSERLGRLHFWLLFIGFNMTFFPWLFIWLGAMLLPNTVETDAFALWNQVSSAGVIIWGLGMIVFFYCMLRAFR